MAASALAVIVVAVFVQIQRATPGAFLNAAPPVASWVSVAWVLTVIAYGFLAARFRWPVPLLLLLLASAPLWVLRPSAGTNLLWQTFWPFTLSFISFVRSRFILRSIDAATLTQAAAGSWLLCVGALLWLVDAYGVIGHSPAIALVPLLAGLAFVAAAVRRQRALSLWLARVRAGKVPTWRIEHLDTPPVRDERWLFVPLTGDAEREADFLVHFETPEEPGQPVARLARGERSGWWSSLVLATAAGMLRLALPIFLCIVLGVVGAAISDGYRFENRDTGQNQPH